MRPRPDQPDELLGPCVVEDAAPRAPSPFFSWGGLIVVVLGVLLGFVVMYADELARFGP
jgi:hypothetical protein